MITFVPTYQGAGVRLWGTQRELMEFNDTVYHYWNALEEASDPIELQRDNILASFCYEIRHGLMGMRTTAKQHPVTKSAGDFYGVEFTWTHILFYFAVLRFNMRTRPCVEKDVELICQVENALRDAISSYSKRYASAMMPFLDGAIYCANPYLAQYMEEINYQHLYQLRYSSAKNAFGFLVEYLDASVYNSFRYVEILVHLQKNAKRLGCEISELSHEYDKTPYDFKW